MGGRKRKLQTDDRGSVTSIEETTLDKVESSEDEEEFVREQAEAGRLQFLLDLDHS